MWIDPGYSKYPPKFSLDLNYYRSKSVGMNEILIEQYNNNTDFNASIISNPMKSNRNEFSVKCSDFGVNYAGWVDKFRFHEACIIR